MNLGAGAAIALAGKKIADDRADEAAWRAAHPNAVKYSRLLTEMVDSAVGQAKEKHAKGAKHAATVAVPVNAKEFATLEFDNLAEMGVDNVAGSPYIQKAIKAKLDAAGYTVTGFGASGPNGEMNITLFKKPLMQRFNESLMG